MNIGKIKGYTRIIGESQGYIGLPLRDAHYSLSLNDLETKLKKSVGGPGPGEPILLRQQIVSWTIAQLKKIAVTLPPIRDGVQDSSVTGPGTPCMESIYYPSAEDVALLMAGKPIKLSVLGVQHPPVMLSVAGEDDVAEDSKE